MYAEQHEPQAVDQYREPVRAAVRPAQIDEIGLEIPAFLRRNNLSLKKEAAFAMLLDAR